MRKSIILFLGIFLTFLLIGCQDQKAFNDRYNVIFFTGTGSSYITSTYIDSLFDVEEGTKLERPEDPIADGYIFLGWYKEKECINVWDFDNDVVEKSLVLYPKWRIGIFTIAYVFDELGGNLIDNPIIEYTTSKVITLPKAARVGGTFKGWILTPVSEYKVGNTILVSTEGYAQDLVLYALFTNTVYTITYIANLSGVTAPRVAELAYGGPMKLPVLTDPSGQYNFVGWFSLDGSKGDNGYQYHDGDIYRGVAKFDTEKNEWVFTPGKTFVYAIWQAK